MANDVILSGDLFYYLLVPVVLASIPTIINLIKRSELSGQKTAISELNINTMREDLAEVKSNVKESRAEIQQMRDNINAISMLKEKIQKVEDVVENIIPRFEDALRTIAINKLKIEHLEEEKYGGEHK